MNLKMKSFILGLLSFFVIVECYNQTTYKELSFVLEKFSANENEHELYKQMIDEILLVEYEYATSTQSLNDLERFVIKYDSIQNSHPLVKKAKVLIFEYEYQYARASEDIGLIKVFLKKYNSKDFCSRYQYVDLENLLMELKFKKFINDYKIIKNSNAKDSIPIFLEKYDCYKETFEYQDILKSKTVELVSKVILGNGLTIEEGLDSANKKLDKFLNTLSNQKIINISQSNSYLKEEYLISIIVIYEK